MNDHSEWDSRTSRMMTSLSVKTEKLKEQRFMKIISGFWGVQLFTALAILISIIVWAVHTEIIRWNSYMIFGIPLIHSIILALLTYDPDAETVKQKSKWLILSLISIALVVAVWWISNHLSLRSAFHHWLGNPKYIFYDLFEEDLFWQIGTIYLLVFPAFNYAYTRLRIGAKGNRGIAGLFVLTFGVAWLIRKHHDLFLSSPEWNFEPLAVIASVQACVVLSCTLVIYKQPLEVKG